MHKLVGVGIVMLVGCSVPSWAAVYEGDVPLDSSRGRCMPIFRAVVQIDAGIISMPYVTGRGVTISVLKGKVDSAGSFSAEGHIDGASQLRIEMKGTVTEPVVHVKEIDAVSCVYGSSDLRRKE